MKFCQFFSQEIRGIETKNMFNLFSYTFEKSRFYMHGSSIAMHEHNVNCLAMNGIA